MHRLVQENLEEILTGCGADHPASRHLAECGDCRDTVAAMRQHAALMREWRQPDDLEARAGFYARVMERIEAQGPLSIWSLFFDGIFGRRIAVASLAFALLLGVYLISTEPMGELAFSEVPAEMFPVPMATGQFVALHDHAGVMLPGEPDQDSVLVNLVTYREQ
jgi:hypothetical protein